MAKLRLDERLVFSGLVETRSRARDLVTRGFATVNGEAWLKPGKLVADDATVALVAAVPAYVSRGAEKLVPALDAFGFDPAGLTALDAGASTGGFTEVLLWRRAARVVAVDVGSGQLHASLANDPRVIKIENVDVRSLTSDIVPYSISALTADLSFISLRKALPAALCLVQPGGWAVALVKPQFELTPADIGKGGIVRNSDARERALALVRDWFGSQPGWSVHGVIPSPIAGGSGNQEYLIGARKHG